jgi:hypothetical protein
MSLEWTICITRDHLWGVGQASTWLVGSIHKELCACQGGTPPYPSHCTWLVGFATCKTWPTTHHSTSRGKYHIYISKIHVYTEYQNTHIMAESSHHQTCNMFIIMWRTYRNRLPHPLPKSSPCPRTLIANSNTLLIQSEYRLEEPVWRGNVQWVDEVGEHKGHQHQHVGDPLVNRCACNRTEMQASVYLHLISWWTKRHENNSLVTQTFTWSWWTITREREWILE